MIDEPHRSQAAAYGGLIEDIRNDGVMLDQFIPVAMQVNDLDIKRLKMVAIDLGTMAEPLGPFSSTAPSRSVGMVSTPGAIPKE